MKKRLVSVIIPTYNERENIARLIPIIVRVFGRNTRFRYEIIIVDDNSPDRTGRLVRSFESQVVRLITPKRKRGLGEAIRMGIRQAKGDIVLGMDADFNHDPQKIPLLLGLLDTHSLVVGSRFTRGGGMKDLSRFWASYIFNGVLRVFFGFPIWDNTSGFYAIYRSRLRELGINKIYYGYGEYHLRLVFFAQRHGLTIQEIPVSYPLRTYGQSKSKLLIMMIAYLRVAHSLKKIAI